jgi:hypothetical protein
MWGSGKSCLGYSRPELFRIIAGVLVACSVGFSFSGSAVGREKKPNLIFILSDDHRWDAMGNMGHPFIRTPNLDRLGKEGIRFQNSFVVTPLCSPSRASFLTGQYAHRHGVKNNLTPWNDRNETFLELLKKRGGQDMRIFTAGPVIGIAVLGIMSYVMIFWGVPAESPGTKWFYIYQEGYKALFG